LGNVSFGVKSQKKKHVSNGRIEKKNKRAKSKKVGGTRPKSFGKKGGSFTEGETTRKN